MRDRNDSLSSYVDVKSLYDFTSASEASADELEKLGIDEGIFQSHALRKVFLGAVVSELLKEIDKHCEEMSVWDAMTGRKKAFVQLREKMTSLHKKAGDGKLVDQEIPVLRRITTSWKTKRQSEHAHASEAGASAAISSVNAKATVNASTSDFDKSLDDNELYEDYSTVVLSSFPFAEIISEIKDILQDSGLKRLVVFFDDFSELGFVDQRLFVDIVLAPLNNSSNEAVKLKIAGYPGRVYYGRIDSTKVDTINLDFANLYEAGEIQTMEGAAIEYTKRLLETRFKAFEEELATYFDPAVSVDDHMRVMFQTTFNVPRLMGALLHTCYLDRIAQGRVITTTSLRLAARKYYESTVAQYFDRMNRFALEPFENKLDRHNQGKLLECVVKESIDVRRNILAGSVGGTYFNEVKNPPTSHFVVSATLSEMFRSLESNFIVTRYKDTRDKDGNAVVVFALHYGLTESERMSWGYPAGREYRNYFVQRCFDFTISIHQFLAKNQTIRCNHCGKSHPLEQRSSFELYAWKCPDCTEGHCSVVNLSDDFKAEVEQLNQALMLEGVELDILNTLDADKSKMRAGELSALLDVSYQLVGRRTSKLQDMGLVKKESGPDGKKRSAITEKGHQTYFSEAE